MPKEERFRVRSTEDSRFPPLRWEENHWRRRACHIGPVVPCVVRSCLRTRQRLALTHAATSVTVARMATLAAARLRIGIPGCAPARVRRRTNEQTNEREPTVLPLLKPLRKKRIEGIGFITTSTKS